MYEWCYVYECILWKCSFGLVIKNYLLFEFISRKYVFNEFEKEENMGEKFNLIRVMDWEM